MIWTAYDYNEETVRSHSIICIASELFRETSDKKRLYALGARDQPVEPFSYNSPELETLRSSLQWLCLSALDNDWEIIKSELEWLKKHIYKHGSAVHHINSFYRTGIWGTRSMAIERMFAALEYVPFAVPGDEFKLKTSLEDIWEVEVEHISTGKYSRYYQVYIKKENRSHNERFTASDSYDSIYNAKKRKEQRTVPYPFSTLVEERVANGQNIGIEV